MKKFKMPTIEIQRLAPEDVFTNSCTTEALGCDSCYCSGVICTGTYSSGCTSDKCPSNTNWDDDE